MRKYTIDFALITLTGNLTRFLILKPLVEEDKSVIARWYPIRTWVKDDPLRFLPNFVRIRMRHFLDSWKLYFRSPGDAIVIHAFETYYLYCLLHRLLNRKTIIIKNPDGELPGQSKLTRWLIRNAVSRTTLFIPWSTYTANLIKDRFPFIPDKKIVIIHPGLDLKLWPMRTPKGPSERFKLLFVGGDLLRKGGDTLLDTFKEYLSDTCELYICTQSGYVPEEFKHLALATPFVHLYLDLLPNSQELHDLYKGCDAFVLPTNGDSSAWVALEAMATGIPVIICPVGGIPDIVKDEVTGLLIPPKNPKALANAVERLRNSSELQNKIITQGREHIEENFDGKKNIKKILDLVKHLINTQNA